MELTREQITKREQYIAWFIKYSQITFAEWIAKLNQYEFTEPIAEITIRADLKFLGLTYPYAYGESRKPKHAPFTSEEQLIRAGLCIPVTIAVPPAPMEIIEVEGVTITRLPIPPAPTGKNWYQFGDENMLGVDPEDAIKAFKKDKNY